MVDPDQIPWLTEFLIGGAAGMAATCIVHPIDLVKYRMQMSGVGGLKRTYKNTFDCFRKVIKKEGFWNLWTGVGAALLRQATFTASRLGTIQMMIARNRNAFRSQPTVSSNVPLTVVIGIIGAILGNPAEVALIRMSIDGNLPPKERRNYKNAFNAMSRIVKDEGFLGLWVGLSPSILQCIVVSSLDMPSYLAIKDYFQNGPLQMNDGVGLQIVTSIFTGFLIALASKPFDLAKTRIQSMKIVRGKKPLYFGTTDVLYKIYKKEGFFSLWKGITPYFCKITPHTILSFLFIEKMYRMYFKYVLGIDVDDDDS